VSNPGQFTTEYLRMRLMSEGRGDEIRYLLPHVGLASAEELQAWLASQPNGARLTDGGRLAGGENLIQVSPLNPDEQLPKSVEAALIASLPAYRDHLPVTVLLAGGGAELPLREFVVWLRQTDLGSLGSFSMRWRAPSPEHDGCVEVDPRLRVNPSTRAGDSPGKRVAIRGFGRLAGAVAGTVAWMRWLLNRPRSGGPS